MEEFSKPAAFTVRVSLKNLPHHFSLSSLRSFVANQLPDLGLTIDPQHAVVAAVDDVENAGPIDADAMGLV